MTGDAPAFSPACLMSSAQPTSKPQHSCRRMRARTRRPALLSSHLPHRGLASSRHIQPRHERGSKCMAERVGFMPVQPPSSHATGYRHRQASRPHASAASTRLACRQGTCRHDLPCSSYRASLGQGFRPADRAGSASGSRQALSVIHVTLTHCVVSRRCPMCRPLHQVA